MINYMSKSSLDITIKNPLIFYTGVDWCTTPNNNFWGGEDVKSPDEKTMFDPSPVGWRVPPYKGSASPWTAFTKTTFKSSNYGRIYNNETFYPFAGFRDNSSGVLYGVGSYGRCWSGSPSGTRAYYLHFSDYIIYSRIHSNYRGYGYSVRCVKE